MSPQRITLAEPSIPFEDATCIVLNKPSGWHSAKAGQRAESSGPDVETWLRGRFEWAGSLPEAGLVHRLDQPTSRCLLAAKMEEEQEDLRHRLRTGSIKKIYFAIVEPGLAKRGEFQLFFSSRYRRSQKTTVRETGDPKEEGRCRWKVRLETGRLAVAEVELIGPGRRHQIRAGLAHLGFPILGDHLYGGAPWPAGFGLHAWQLKIGDVIITAPPSHWKGIDPELDLSLNSEPAAERSLE